jgi:hypothetical protein
MRCRDWRPTQGKDSVNRFTSRDHGIRCRTLGVPQSFSTESPPVAVRTLGVELLPEGVQLVVKAGSGFQSLDTRSVQMIRYLATLMGASTHIQQVEEQGWRLRVAVPHSGLSR